MKPIADAAYCLSLDSRPDRWEEFVRSLRDSDTLCDLDVRRYRATLPDEMIVPDYWSARFPSDYATRVDHLSMIQDAYTAGAGTVLIFEDDAIVQPGFDAAYELLFANLPRDWKGVWFAGDDWGIPTPVAPGVVRLRNRTRTRMHAYPLNRKGMHRVYSHVLHEVNSLIDHAVGRLHAMEPFFYGTPSDTVSQSCLTRAREGATS